VKGRAWATSGPVRKTPSDDIAVTFNPDGWFDPAHEELTPMPMVNNPMASEHAAVKRAFATAV
jgi:hypothetical protein